ncbi:MAG TPA: hypothetical protein VFL98_00475 [Candidatus Paceibacterota bacterium]|nr:hypothetical protein [Candidatus Paceibacterota bacterium]
MHPFLRRLHPLAHHAVRVTHDTLDLLAFFAPFLRLSWALMQAGMVLAALGTSALPYALALAAMTYGIEALLAFRSLRLCAGARRHTGN